MEKTGGEGEYIWGLAALRRLSVRLLDSPAVPPKATVLSPTALPQKTTLSPSVTNPSLLLSRMRIPQLALLFLVKTQSLDRLQRMSDEETAY